MRGKLRKITVAMDASNYSLTAAKWGAFIASHVGAELELLHVVDIRVMNSPFLADISGALGAAPYEEFVPKMKVLMQERGEDILKGGVSACKEFNITPSTKVESGILNEVIENTSQNTDLIVLGRRGEHFNIGLHLFGSDGEKLARHAGCSCLIVPDFFSLPKRILIGVHNSGPSRSAGHWGEFLSEIFPDNEVFPIFVREDENEVSEFKKIAGKDVIVREGNAEDELISFCSENPEFTILVVGATGHTRTLKEFIIGTVSSHLLHKTESAVLLAR
ncbi:MAG: universal stress protein [Verrucomicrobiota bacterium]|nr:universal stress protein [Verrucomicrobiota bacterium]